MNPAHRSAPAAPAAESVLSRLASGVPADSELVDAYYTLCIPFYREFLGEHWHTGWYRESGPIGPADALRMERRIAQAAAIGPGSRVLDVGCGIGGAACHLAAVSGAFITGLTPVAAQRDLALALAQERGVAQRVDVVLGKASQLPETAGGWDAVLIFESACHFPDRPRFFSEVRRVLRPGGRLAGEDWLACTRAPEPLRCRHTQAVEAAWAIPRLDTLQTYVDGMTAAGLQVLEAVDLRDEMPLLRGFAASAAARQLLQDELNADTAVARDPVRRQIIQALAVLGGAAEHGAFTVGRFTAERPAERTVWVA